MHWLRPAGVRALLPIGNRQGVAQRLPAMQPVPVRSAGAPLALLQGREYLLPAGLLQVQASDLDLDLTS